jgi:hypothetical protein
MEIKGLTEFQKELLEIAQDKLPRESFKVMRKLGSRARVYVAKRARQVNKVSGNYIGKGPKKYGWKRSKAFYKFDEYGVTVYNKAPHAHLVEHGHRMVTQDGKEAGFVKGQKVRENGMDDFEASGEVDEILSKWLDDLLESGKL